MLSRVHQNYRQQLQRRQAELAAAPQTDSLALFRNEPWLHCLSTEEQHEWARIISTDLQAMQHLPKQHAFSNAYLQGAPKRQRIAAALKKRKTEPNDRSAASSSSTASSSASDSAAAGGAATDDTEGSEQKSSQRLQDSLESFIRRAHTSLFSTPADDQALQRGTQFLCPCAIDLIYSFILLLCHSIT